MDSLQSFSDFYTRHLLGNTLWRWPLFILLIAVLIGVFVALQKRLSGKFTELGETRENPFIKFLADALLKTKPVFVFFVALWISSALLLDLAPRLERVLEGAAVFCIFLQVALWGSSFITYWLYTKALRAAEQDPGRTTALTALGIVLKSVLWVAVVLLILENFGVDVTALVAGLGVGGIAVALAVQNILGDLLCSVSILLDKPFEVGDFIIIGDKLGVVERIGIKSTRLRSLHGEQIVISNSDLIASRIQNYKRMAERRVVFGVGVVYDTPEDKLERIPGMLREVVESSEITRFDRAHFKSFGSYSLDFEVVYYILSSDYNLYMDTQQQINFEIFHRFAEQGIEFAYPTQTVFVDKAV